MYFDIIRRILKLSSYQKLLIFINEKTWWLIQTLITNCLLHLLQTLNLWVFSDCLTEIFRVSQS
jgi:hypothetical protein